MKSDGVLRQFLDNDSCVVVREVERNPEYRISVLETKSGSTPLANVIQIYLFLFLVKEFS